MKILLAGDFEYYFFEEAVAESMEDLGCEVLRFSCKKFLRGFLGKLEYHFSWIGMLSLWMNYRLFRIVRNQQPDMLFIWRGTLIHPFLLKIIKRSCDVKMVSYNNDDPFSPVYRKGSIHQKRLWKNFVKGIPHFDVNLVYRPHNIEDYNKVGSPKTLLFPPYFIPKLVEKNRTKIKKYDVTFIGHYTPDRAEAINYLLENAIDVKLYGPDWDEKVISEKYSYHRNIQPVYGDDYFRAIHSSKVCLAFLSKLNRDVYTCRCFEIPACGTLMLSQRTEALEKLYEPGKEALFFSSHEELLEMVNRILSDVEGLKKIGMAGRNRAYSSGYDVRARVHALIKSLQPL